MRECNDSRTASLKRLTAVIEPRRAIDCHVTVQYRAILKRKNLNTMIGHDTVFVVVPSTLLRASAHS